MRCCMQMPGRLTKDRNNRDLDTYRRAEREPPSQVRKRSRSSRNDDGDAGSQVKPFEAWM